MANTTKNSKGKASMSMTGQSESDPMLKELFVDGIKDVYYAEKHIIKTLPKMMKAATSEELKSAFAEHLEVSKIQVTRLENIFELLGKKPQAKKCEAIEGITKEGEGVIESTEKGTATRDVGLIMSAQKVEHYEIASYGGLAQLATTLGMTEAAELLATTLQEEKETDVLLSEIAENSINYDAVEESIEEMQG